MVSLESCVEFCGQLLGRPTTDTKNASPARTCSSTAWPHSISGRRSTFPAKILRAPVRSHDEHHHDYSYPRPLGDGALLGALGQTLLGKRLQRDRRQLARHGRRHRATSV